MRIHAVMCIRNEAHRYLQSCLQWHRGQFDSLFVYDDQSGDQSIDIVKGFRDIICERRPDEVPSFLEDEGAFRQAAFDKFEEVVGPSEGDWILALDADEFVVTDHFSRSNNLFQLLSVLADTATEKHAASVELDIPEVWDMAPIRVRTDGYWGSLKAPRLFRYVPPAVFSKKKMGGGCWPTYIEGLYKLESHLLKILHYGYAFESDRLAKYNRYTSLAENGHNSSHIESIITQAMLVPWNGSTPEVWRGIRG